MVMRLGVTPALSAIATEATAVTKGQLYHHVSAQVLGNHVLLLMVAHIKQNFSNDFYDYLIQNSEKYISEKHIEIKDNKLRLTRKGVNISNLIISELFKL